MAYSPEQHVPEVVQLLAELPNRSGERLVNGLVEPGHVFSIAGFRCRRTFSPQLEDACPKCSILGNQLPDVHTDLQTMQCVRRTRCIYTVLGNYVTALRLFRLLSLTLR